MSDDEKRVCDHDEPGYCAEVGCWLHPFWRTYGPPPVIKQIEEAEADG